ncbi:related to delta3-cis-delta2-trans-enoyl-CoA isomerase [Cephalotrichum gorgonifer]|uniref:Related to delta3-cis-delta2-trans-enoyl-CoA isomerase n=1 Tax=Cephalotrichum gorgonifer TaxID=2041049 RepID=A0AAE8MYN5_9PEZI|nr:related to delta3-cis-delta2-trans-enoyl-CoA isomerase [Cephalotrichum gorgonifer]
MSSPSIINVEYKDRVAVLTIDNAKKLNALSQDQYFELATRMNEIAARDDIFVTVIIGTGRFFSAGADVTVTLSSPSAAPDRRQILSTFLASNLNLTRAFYTHPKILVAALNGPVIGLSAALVSLSDFIYCTPSAFLLTPFSSLGLVAEGVASRSLVKRLGPAKANEALIMSRKVGAEDLKACGYVNEIFAQEGFKERVLREVDEKLGSHLVGESLLGIKKLIRDPEIEELERQNVVECFDGVERLLKGIPQDEFAKIARGEKRHKL